MKTLFVIFVLFYLVEIKFTNSACHGRNKNCYLPLETGLCDAIFYKFGFDPVQKKCVQFVYGGCGGNRNRFDTIEACQAYCRWKWLKIEVVA